MACFMVFRMHTHELVKVVITKRTLYCNAGGAAYD
jgi:hypothetical protein